MIVPAVTTTVTVNAPIERAWRVFTESFNTWWPRQHHIRQADLAEAVLEAREGGRWYERGVDGGECDWGRVLVFEPPYRLVLRWQIDGSVRYDSDPARASEVEVTFVDLGGGQTRVNLEHRGFARHGADGQRVRDAVSGPGGWPGIMDGYAKIAEVRGRADRARSWAAGGAVVPPVQDPCLTSIPTGAPEDRHCDASGPGGTLAGRQRGPRHRRWTGKQNQGHEDSVPTPSASRLAGQ